MHHSLHIVLKKMYDISQALRVPYAVRVKQQTTIRSDYVNQKYVLQRGAAQNVPDLPSVALRGYRHSAAVIMLGVEHKSVSGINGPKVAKIWLRFCTFRSSFAKPD
jgi:hypothetical protein